jgi:hypothetical protein
MEVRLVWPILLGFGVAVVVPLPTVCGLGHGPRLRVASLGDPVGPASTMIYASDHATIASWNRSRIIGTIAG